MRRAIEVIVSYSGDAEDFMTVSLKFEDEDGGSSTVRLLNDVKTEPRYQDGVNLLDEIVGTGLICDTWGFAHGESDVHELWNVVVPIR